jgi:hypothetical protein
MRKKTITKDCPSCNDMKINDDNEFECSWGNSKEIKILKNPKGRIKICKLISIKED